jgi:hypothetical protein
MHLITNHLNTTQKTSNQRNGNHSKTGHNHQVFEWLKTLVAKNGPNIRLTDTNGII